MAAAARRKAVGTETIAALGGGAGPVPPVHAYVHVAASRRGYAPLDPAAVLRAGPCLAVDVVQLDTLVAALQLTAAGLRPLVLNMASFSTPGGGFLNGAGTQEEELCRRSTLYPSLDAAAAEGHKYPIPPLGLLLHDEINIIRGTGPAYAWLASPYATVGVLSCPAVRRPELVGSGCYLNKADAMLTAQKMELMLAAAVTHGYDVLLLGALGCGAYKNPPRHVAQLFAATLARYGASFKQVRFAILDGGPSLEAGASNFRTFADMFP